MLKSMFSTSSGSSSSTNSKKRSSSEISSSLTQEQINMWVKASKNENNLNRTVTIHGSPNPFVLRRITDTGFGEKKITMKDILNKPTDKNVDFGYRIPEGIILVESVSDGVMFANGQTDVEILIHRSIPHHLTGKFKTITNDERYTVYPHKGMDDRFEYAVPTTITARNQDDEEKNEYQMAWSLGVDEKNKDGSATHDYYKYTPYKMEGNDGLWDDDQIEKRWWWDQEGPLALLRNTHIYFPGDITYNKILAWDDAREFNVFKMFPYNNQTNNKLYKQFIHESLYNNALEEGVDTEEITAKINNDEQFYMKYGEDYGAYTFGNKHRPEIEVLEIDKKINKDTHFRDKKGNIKDITTRELIDAFVKIYKPTKENPMILYMNSCIPDIKARNIKDGDAFMRDQRAKIREIFKTVISKQPNKKDILRSLKQEEEGNERTNKWFLEEARARVEEQNTAARNKADEEVDKIQYDQEAEQSVIINLQKHKLWKSGRDKFIELRNHLANNKNKYYSEKDYPSLKWEDMPLVKREVVMFGKEERHTWYKENYGKYFKYVDNNIKNIENDRMIKNNINNGLNMLYEQSKLDSFGRLLPALWKKVEKYEYLKSIWINNGWEQLEKSSELKNETYAKNLGGGGILSQPIDVNELVANEFYQFNNHELNPNTFQIQVRERKHAQYLYTQNNIAFFKYNELHFLTPSINDTIFTDNLYKCRCDICNPPNRARSPSFGGGMMGQKVPDGGILPEEPIKEGHDFKPGNKVFWWIGEQEAEGDMAIGEIMEGPTAMSENDERFPDDFGEEGVYRWVWKVNTMNENNQYLGIEYVLDQEIERLVIVPVNNNEGQKESKEPQHGGGSKKRKKKRRTRKKRGRGRRRTRKKRGGVMQLKVDDLYTIQAKTLNVETSTFVWKYIDVRFDYYDEHDKAYHFTKKADGGRLKFYGIEHNDDISNKPNNGNWGDIKLMNNIEGGD